MESEQRWGHGNGNQILLNIRKTGDTSLTRYVRQSVCLIGLTSSLDSRMEQERNGGNWSWYGNGNQIPPNTRKMGATGLTRCVCRSVLPISLSRSKMEREQRWKLIIRKWELDSIKYYKKGDTPVWLGVLADLFARSVYQAYLVQGWRARETVGIDDDTAMGIRFYQIFKKGGRHWSDWVC